MFLNYGCTHSIEPNGQLKYADSYETSFYNAYLGSFNTFDQIENNVCFSGETIEAMPYDSYSPLTKGSRGVGIGGKKTFSDGSYYGCCASIASAGVGMFHEIQTLKTESSIVINLFEKGSVALKTPSENPIKTDFDTNYPKDGNVKITLSMDKAETFDILIRNPYWSKNTEVLSSGAIQNEKDGYILLSKSRKDNDEIEIRFDMSTYVIPAPV